MKTVKSFLICLTVGSQIFGASRFITHNSAFKSSAEKVLKALDADFLAGLEEKGLFVTRNGNLLEFDLDGVTYTVEKESGSADEKTAAITVEWKLIKGDGNLRNFEAISVFTPVASGGVTAKTTVDIEYLDNGITDNGLDLMVRTEVIKLMKRIKRKLGEAPPKEDDKE